MLNIFIGHNMPINAFTAVIPTAPGNGGITSTYRWTQTLSDLMIMVPLPAGTKTKSLDVTFTNNKLKVRSSENILVYVLCISIYFR